MTEYIHTQSGARVSVADGKELGVGFVPVGGQASAERSDTPDKSWKVVELKAFADEQGIDLGDATKKDDILAAIDAVGESSGDDESADDAGGTGDDE
ncbi:hypothetical protein EDF60_1684 [Leucobacter luti]|uniref:hypothetical protein n=1 Tax=Leucobacter luti TaxID=340320 RepID=UPI0010540394|nr:hypothetical protein [Leucobacter luti]MCW2287033.1 hypothetical protein [Leucobacter luti]TCK41258.1 hypothetical protein EDF60_1684 [Leucobacter luti]